VSGSHLSWLELERFVEILEAPVPDECLAELERGVDQICSEVERAIRDRDVPESLQGCVSSRERETDPTCA